MKQAVFEKCIMLTIVSVVVLASSHRLHGLNLGFRLH